MKQWTTARLGNIAELSLGKMLDEKKNRGEPLPYLANLNVRWGEFDLQDLREMRFGDNEKDRYGLRRGDIVMCEGGEPGRCAIWKETVPGMMFQKALHRIRPHECVDSNFLFYLFLHMGKLDRFASLFTGATIKHLPLQNLAKVEISFPRLPVQEAIADILTAYDDLIENNRRRMTLLEEAARLLYQEWFVHLRFPGHEHTPKEEDLPKGWKRVVLKSLIDVTHGYAFQGNFFAEEPTSRVLTTPGNFRIGGGIKISKLKYYSDEGPLDPSYLLSAMDLIVTMTDLSKECDTLGFPAFVPKSKGLSFLHNQRVGKVVPMGQSFPKHFLYCLFCEDNYRHHIVGAATGTSVKHTSPKRILSYAATMPPISFIELFEHMVTPFFQEINCLMQSNDLLRTARDLLLPRLMSGEIEV
jgi:type I restriction enzyme S subunit